MVVTESYDDKLRSIAMVLDEFPPGQIVEAVEILAEDDDSRLSGGDVLTAALNLNGSEEVVSRLDGLGGGEPTPD